MLAHPHPPVALLLVVVVVGGLTALAGLWMSFQGAQWRRWGRRRGFFPPLLFGLAERALP